MYRILDERDLDSETDLREGQRPLATVIINLQWIVFRLQWRNFFQSGFKFSRGSGSQYSMVDLRWEKEDSYKIIYKSLSAYSTGDKGSIPGLGQSPGEGNGNTLQYSCLENPMDREPWLRSMGWKRLGYD